MNFCYRHIVLFCLPLLVQSNISDIAIFCNVCIPGRDYFNHAANIAKEQIDHRKNSNVAFAKLYYVVIEKDITELENCNNCKKIMHFDAESKANILSHTHNYYAIY